jgi:hypothetical protein
MFLSDAEAVSRSAIEGPSLAGRSRLSAATSSSPSHLGLHPSLLRHEGNHLAAGGDGQRWCRQMTSAISLTTVRSSAMARYLQAPWGRTCCFQRPGAAESRQSLGMWIPNVNSTLAAGLPAAESVLREINRDMQRGVTALMGLSFGGCSERQRRPKT